METTASKPKASPKDFFLYLAAIVTLYWSTGSVLRLLFEIINELYPDRLEIYRDPFSASLRFSIASLIIIFPVYLLLSAYLRREAERDPSRRELSIRKWLVYLTLFLAGALIVGDLVALINTFLGGEITVRFLWKVLAILAVAGAIFGYYLSDLRRENGLSARAARNFALAAAVFVIASIAGGFAVMGSPASLRAARFDQARVNDLSGIQYQALYYWQQKRVLPDNLEQLDNPLQNYAVPRDPETGAAYEYVPTSDVAFRLCATFGTDNSREPSVPSIEKPVPAPVGRGEENWIHPAGRYCFDRTIDPELYPPLTNGKPIR